MRTISVLCATIGIYLLWGFNMSAALTGWSALRLIGGLLLISVGYYGWKRYREIAQGLHQWPDGKGPLYDEWMRIPVDQPHADYHAWLVEKKGWKEPWATWAEWSGATRPKFSDEVDRLWNEFNQKMNAGRPSQGDPSAGLSRDQIADQTQREMIRNLQETTGAEEEARQKAQRFRDRFYQAAAQARERLRK